jgi:GT2 family glycosyltransferase
MNPAITLTHNCLELTKRCVDSLWNQDALSRVHIVDNGSTDGTKEWLIQQEEKGLIEVMLRDENRGVSAGWNTMIDLLFSDLYADRAEQCLVIGNDCVLPKSFYSTLIDCKLPFVTGVAVDNMEQANQQPRIYPLEPRPDFSAFCITRECWEKIGPFDERFKHYCGDCDMHIRAHRLGISLWKAAVPFFHLRSSTIRLAPPAEQQEIMMQAHKDREVFQSVYGCLPGTPQYEALFK